MPEDFIPKAQAEIIEWYRVESAKNEAERLRLAKAVREIGQAAHAAHGGRGSFCWCGERCCSMARRAEEGHDNLG